MGKINPAKLVNTLGTVVPEKMNLSKKIKEVRIEKIIKQPCEKKSLAGISIKELLSRVSISKK